MRSLKDSLPDPRESDLIGLVSKHSPGNSKLARAENVPRPAESGRNSGR